MNNNQLRPLTEADLGQDRTLVGSDKVVHTGKVKFIAPPPDEGETKLAILQIVDEDNPTVVMSVVHKPQVVTTK